MPDGGCNFGDAIAGGGQKLSVVFVDEAGGSQVSADGVGGRDGLEAADVAALAGTASGGFDGYVGNIPRQSALPHLGYAFNEVGTSDGGSSLDVDERVNGRDPFEATSENGFADGSRARVILNEGG